MDWHPLMFSPRFPPKQPPKGRLNDEFMTPREVAGLFGVRTTTVARWVREGVLEALKTPGGHRRYLRSEVTKLCEATDSQHEDPQRKQLEQDMARLYDQGWSIRRVADEFGLDYTKTRRILSRATTLRRQGRQW